MIIHDIDFEYGYSTNTKNEISHCGDPTKGACIIESSYGNIVLEIDCKSAELTIFLKGQRITIPDDVCTDICNALRYDFLIAERLEANSLLLFGGREWYAIDLNSFSYRQISKGIDLPGLDGSVSKVFSLNYIVVMCYAKAIVMDSDFFILAHMDYPLGLSRRLFMNLFSH